jgi:hypothetical protein
MPATARLSKASCGLVCVIMREGSLTWSRLLLVARVMVVPVLPLSPVQQ